MACPKPAKAKKKNDREPKTRPKNGPDQNDHLYNDYNNIEVVPLESLNSFDSDNEFNDVIGRSPKINEGTNSAIEVAFSSHTQAISPPKSQPTSKPGLDPDPIANIPTRPNPKTLNHLLAQMKKYHSLYLEMPRLGPKPITFPPLQSLTQTASNLS